MLPEYKKGRNLLSSGMLINSVRDSHFSGSRNIDFLTKRDTSGLLKLVSYNTNKFVLGLFDPWKKKTEFFFFYFFVFKIYGDIAKLGLLRYTL